MVPDHFWHKKRKRKSGLQIEQIFGAFLISNQIWRKGCPTKPEIKREWLRPREGVFNVCP